MTSKTQNFCSKKYGRNRNIDNQRDPLWSSRLVVTHCNDICAAHERFLEAGADMLETCTYQATVEGLMHHLSIDASEAAKLIRSAVELCLKTRDKFWKTKMASSFHKEKEDKPLVVGSIGPYGAFLADRSEYSGSYVNSMSVQQLKEWHRPQVENIFSSGVDLLAFETLPAIKEAVAIVELLREFPDCQAWLSFSCKDYNYICHGEKIESVVELVNNCGSYSNIIGLGVNCFSPEFAESMVSKISSGLKQIGRNENVAVVCYPNGDGEWNADGSWTKANAKNHNQVIRWLDAGATWVGGCCMTSPNDISVMRQQVDGYIAAAKPISQ